MLIDSHCHLDYPPLYDNLEEIIKRATLADVKYLLTISTALDSFKKIKIIVKTYEKVFGTFGIHPHEAGKYKDITYEKIKNYLIDQKKIIGIGETGLDYYYNHSDKKTQKKVFTEHIIASQNLNLPIIIHSRNAENDTYDILRNESLNHNFKILMHCFTGSKQFAKKLLDLGAYISFSGIITFKNSKDLADTVMSVPIDRLLVETDSPYLSPVPYRGKTNEPSFLTYTAEKISKIKNTDINEIKTKTSENFFKLFSFIKNEKSNFNLR